MNYQQMLAIVLIVGGVLALGYGGFTYTKDTHSADMGPIHMEVKERRTVNIPVWAGIGCIVAGGLLLVMGRRFSR